MQVQGGALRDVTDESTFVGYSHTKADANVIVLLQDGQLIEEAHEGESVQIILDETPFYAESGGQIGDKGYLRDEQAVVRIKDVQKRLTASMYMRVLWRAALFKRPACYC